MARQSSIWFAALGALVVSTGLATAQPSYSPPEGRPAGADAKAGRVLTNDSLRNLLEDMGYKADPQKLDNGEMVYWFDVNRDGTIYRVRAALSPSGRKVWLATFTAVLPASDKLSPTAYKNVLDQNGRTASKFEIWNNGGDLVLTRSFDNRAVTAEVFRIEVDGFMADLKDGKSVSDACNKTVAALPSPVPFTPPAPVNPVIKPINPDPFELTPPIKPAPFPAPIRETKPLFPEPEKPVFNPEPKAEGNKVFAPNGGRFRVRMPGNPELKTSEIKTALGNVTLNMYFGGDLLEGYGCGVGFMDVPVVINNGDEGTMLAAVCEGMIAEAKGTVTANNAIKVAGYPAREVTIETETMVIKARAVLVNQRLYQLMIFQSKTNAKAKTATDFFDSFQLTK